MWYSSEFRLGTVTFTLYTTPLRSVINRHYFSRNLYAHNTQIYISLSTPDANSSVKQLRNCLDDLFTGLKLNVDKTGSVNKFRMFSL